MAATFRLEINTPDRPVLDINVTESSIPGAEGYLGILPDHAPLLAEIGNGMLTYKTTDGRTESLLVHEGFVEVLPDHVRVLPVAAERISDIDVERAQAALDRALERLQVNVADIDEARARRALKRAESRLAAAKQYGAR
jgi:F-type H+-transporting ATPase subunit epsilon